MLEGILLLSGAAFLLDCKIYSAILFRTGFDAAVVAAQRFQMNLPDKSGTDNADANLCFTSHRLLFDQ
jgi:hypothetical protein